MAAQLARQEDLRRQMVADIAHELRTPLSVMRLQVESIEDGIVPATPEAVSALGGQLSLLGRLVDDLRLLSLADAGQLSLNLQPVDPTAARADVAAAAAARARQSGVSLGLAIVQRLAAAQGGSVSLASPPGQGATFAVSPLAEPVEASARWLSLSKPAPAG